MTPRPTQRAWTRRAARLGADRSRCRKRSPRTPRRSRGWPGTSGRNSLRALQETPRPPSSLERRLALPAAWRSWISKKTGRVASVLPCVTSPGRNALRSCNQSSDHALERDRNERHVEEVLRVPLDERGDVAQPWVSTSRGIEGENVTKHLSDLPSRTKFGCEARLIAENLECVRSSRANRHLVPSLHNMRFAKALTNAKRAVVHKESLLLAQMPVKRTPIGDKPSQ
jgi:hypothetical protein